MNIKLTYFDFPGGRGEAARLALKLGGVEFEDDRIPGPEWPSLKPQTPYGQLPILEVDGNMVAQSNAINRYVGRVAGLYPTDAWEAAVSDEIMDAIEDIAALAAPSIREKDEDKKRGMRVELANGPLTVYLKQIGERLGTSDYFVEDRLTVVDLRVFVWIRFILSGNLDHVPTDLPARVAPQLVAHFERIQSHPQVEAHYRS